MLYIRVPLEEIHWEDNSEQLALPDNFHMNLPNTKTINKKLRSSLIYRLSFKVLFVPESQVEGAPRASTAEAVEDGVGQAAPARGVYPNASWFNAPEKGTSFLHPFS